MRICTTLLAFSAAVLLSACATHTEETKNIRAKWAAGNVAQAQAELSQAASEKSDTGDILLWKLEEGAAARANGDIAQSAKNFDTAYKIAENYGFKPDVSVSDETGAIFTNQSFLPYKGYNYDKIMMCAYQGMNYMELRDFDRAAVEFIRLGNFQQEAQALNAERIDREAEAIKAAKRKDAKADYDASKSFNNSAAQSQLRKYYGDDFTMDTSMQQAKGIYLNPFAYWISGVYFANKGVDASDRNRAADMFRIGGEMLGGKSRIFAEDYNAARALASGKISKPENTTYVVYETGCAPIRNQFKINLPLYIVAKNVPHVSMNFPYLEKQNSYAPNLRITAGGKTQNLETLADMDAIIDREFKNELPLVLTKTVISAAIKAGAQYAAASAVDDGWAKLAINITGSIYQSMMNDADLRTWTTLPKQIKVARFPTPSDGKVHLEGRTVDVNPNSTNIIFAKRTGANSPILARSFDFSNNQPTRRTIRQAVSTSK